MNNIFINTTNSIKPKSVLIISNEESLISRIKEFQEDTLYKISFFEMDKFNLIYDKLSLFDLVVFDNRKNRNIKEFTDIFEQNFSYKFNIPIILLENEANENQILYKNSNVYSVFLEPIKPLELILNIKLFLNFQNQNKKIEFEKGFYFDVARDELFCDRRVIKLTRTEKSLVKLLIERKNQLVTYETIERIVWRNKNFSKYSLRNIIKHIREKTHNSLIKNASNRGYVVNTL